MNNKIKKIISCLFILIAIVGVFGYGKNVEAESESILRPRINQCVGGVQGKTSSEVDRCLNLVKNEICIEKNDYGGGNNFYYYCIDEISKAKISVAQDILKASAANAATAAGGAQKASGAADFQSSIDNACQPGFFTAQWSFDGCLLKFIYYTVFAIPSGILAIAAYFFNILISLVIQSSMYDHGFINKAWVVVRDLSNIFFILILLYVAIKTVLNMGGHETKSMITSVIIMAVLINFSLFFTKIVIDSSNILALIFYNKLEVTYEKDGKPTQRPYAGVETEKDVAGSLYQAFDATKLLKPEFIEQLSTQQATKPGPGGAVVQTEPVQGLKFIPTLVIILVSGGIMIVATYALFTSGIFFIGRIIELWLLMIFSPFAFMSFAVPKLSHTEYGWDKWAEKLLSTAFMAPIFMFFMYLIFQLLGAGLFDSFLKPGPDAIGAGKISSILSGAMGKILSILLPALIIMGMLLKAKDLAKKGGGQFGEMVMTGAKMAGGLALAATGAGVAAVGTRVAGGAALKTLGDAGIRATALGDQSHFTKMALQTGDKRWTEDPTFQKQKQKEAQKQLERAGKNANRSFDFRDTKVGKFVAQKSGLNFDHNKAMEFMGWDTHTFEGGVMGQIKHSKEHSEKDLKNYQLSAPEANEQDRLAKERKERIKQYEKDKITAQENRGAFVGDDEKKFRELYEEGMDLSVYGMNRNSGKGSVTEKIQTSKERNADIKTQYMAQNYHPVTPDTENKEGIIGALKGLGKGTQTVIKETFNKETIEKAAKGTVGGVGVSAAAGGLAAGTMAGAVGAVTVVGAAAGVGIPILGASFLKSLKKILRNEDLMHSYGLAEVQRPKSAEQKMKEAMKEFTAADKKAEGGGATAPAHHEPVAAAAGGGGHAEAGHGGGGH